MDLSRPRAAARTALTASLALALVVTGALVSPPSAQADGGAEVSVTSSDLQLTSAFDGLGFDVVLGFTAELPDSCTTGWFKPVLYTPDGSGFGAETPVIRSLGWREVTEAGLQKLFFRVTEPGSYGVALLSPALGSECIEGPAEIGDATAATAEITLVRTPTVNVVIPVITGVAQVGRTLAANTGSWQGPLLDFGYEWLRSGAPIEGATSDSYELTPSDLGTTITVRVTATSHHDSAVAASTATAKVALGTIPTYTPVITGTRTVGATLGVTVPDGNTYAYQWYRGTTKITGATKSTYTLTAADGATAIKVATVASRLGYTPLSRTSAATTTILKKLSAPVPTISGVVRVGTALKVVTGIWGPAPVTLKYQWSVDGVPVTGATGAAFAPRTADLGKSVSVAVTGSKSTYATVVKTSAVSLPVALGAISLPVPTISGTVRAGSRLSAVIGTTAPAVASLTLDYQWLANGVPIEGATGSTFTPDNSSAGVKLAVRVTASNPFYVTRILTSAVTVPVVGVLSAPTPVLTGTARIDNTVCVVPGTWSPAATLRYSWFLNGTQLSATSSCIKITSASWKGMRLVAKVTGTKSYYATRTLASAASAAIVVPDRTTPVSLNSCPAWAPIKGNASSKIYHMPGQRFYNVTNPEECFRTEAAAVAAGYRKAKV